MYDVNLNWESLPHGGPSRIVLHILQCLVKKGDVNVCRSHSYLKKDNLSALIDHESNTVRQTVASTSNVPARVDHVDLGLDLIWMDNVNRTNCCRLRDVQGVPENVPSRHFHSGFLRILSC